MVARTSFPGLSRCNSLFGGTHKFCQTCIKALTERRGHSQANEKLLFQKSISYLGHVFTQVSWRLRCIRGMPTKDPNSHGLLPSWNIFSVFLTSRNYLYQFVQEMRFRWTVKYENKCRSTSNSARKSGKQSRTWKRTASPRQYWHFCTKRGKWHWIKILPTLGFGFYHFKNNLIKRRIQSVIAYVCIQGLTAYTIQRHEKFSPLNGWYYFLDVRAHDVQSGPMTTRWRWKSICRMHPEDSYNGVSWYLNSSTLPFYKWAEIIRLPTLCWDYALLAWRRLM